MDEPLEINGCVHASEVVAELAKRKLTNVGTLKIIEIDTRRFSATKIYMV